MPDLNLYFNNHDWIIAYSPQDAMDLFCEYYGEKQSDYSIEEYRIVPKNTVLTMHDDLTGKSFNGTVSWFISTFGRCFLMSIDY